MTAIQTAPAPGDYLGRLRDPDPEVRRIAVMELPYCDEDDIQPLLLQGMADSDGLVRAEAAHRETLAGAVCGPRGAVVLPEGVRRIG